VKDSSSILLVVLVAVILGASSLYYGVWPQSSPAHAGSEQNVTGYAWSDNVGWISFNCTDDNSCAGNDYGVNIDSGGNLSGYAWSNTIGWISFSESSGCPEAGCVTNPKFDKGTGEVTGWARACSGTAMRDCTGGSRTDGWDGWIKLSGTTADGHPYGPIVANDASVSGYSWGSSVVGWLSWGGTGYGVMSPVNIVCTGSLTADPMTVNQGQSPTITWSVSGGPSCANSCTGSGFETGGAISGTVVASVPPTPPTTSYALTCTGGRYDSPPPVNLVVTVIVPTVTITANGQSTPARVNPETPNNTTIAWTSSDAESCSVTKNGAGWRTGLSSAGSVDSVTVQTIYTADCVNSYGAHGTASITVNVLSGFNEY